MLNRNFAVTGAFALAVFPFCTAQTSAGQASAPLQQYTQTNLVSNVAGMAAVTDPNLTNAWGLSRSSGSPWWVSDNGTGLSTLYDGTGKTIPLVVTIPPSDPNASSTGTPTGTIFNGTPDFAIAPGKSAVFLFATEDGTISGWNPTVMQTQAVIAVNEGAKSSFKGLTMASASVNGGPVANYLYAANFRQGKVSVYDSTFHHAAAIEANFAKFHAPGGLVPFNVQNIGGSIYVAYAKPDADRHDEVDGAGLGLVVAFHAGGRPILALQRGPWFNAPWGMAMASGDFGIYSHDLLVGNFGSGEILAFDPVSGGFLGKLKDTANMPIQIQGLWGLSFGSGAGSGSATALYFAAGPNHEADGLFGSLTAVQNVAGNDQ